MRTRSLRTVIFLAAGVGLLVASFAALAFVLIFLLLRAEKRWTPVYRSTLIGGVVAGLLFAGMVGLVGTLVFGCP